MDEQRVREIVREELKAAAATTASDLGDSVHGPWDGAGPVGNDEAK